MDISDLLAPEGVKLRAGASSKRQALHLAAGAAAGLRLAALLAHPHPRSGIVLPRPRSCLSWIRNGWSLSGQ